MGRQGESLILRALTVLAVLVALVSCRNDLAEVVRDDVEAWQTDQEPPRVASFTTTSPAVRYDFEIPISLVGSADVTRYLVNESATAPLASSGSWLTSAPATFTASAGFGTKRIYAWVKNDRDLVNTVLSWIDVEVRDYEAPSVDTFSASPDVTYTPTVSISLSSSTWGAGASAITHWMVNESSVAPTAADPDWLEYTAGSPPSSEPYSLSSGLKSYTLYAWVKNDQGKVSLPATYTVSYVAYGAPTIDTFVLTSPTPTDNTTIAFNLSTASYGVGCATIAGWMVNESSTPPDAAGGGWLGSAPSGFTMPATSGTHTVYAWVKNEQGLVNATKSISATINVPGGAWSSPYVNGWQLAAHQSLSVVSTVDLQAGTTAVSGIGTGLATLGGDDRTITVAPGAAGNGLWNAGSATLTVTASTVYGVPFSKSITLSVFNGFCVRPAPDGSDLAAGTTVAPFAKIPYAITQAGTKYTGAGRTAEIRVSLGSFTTDWNGSVDRIVMVDGVSLLGGFPVSFQTSGRAIDVAVKSSLTAITDVSSGGGAAWSTANRAVSFETAGIEDIGRATVLEGFFITGGGGSFAAGVMLHDLTNTDTTTAAPTIRQNRIYAGTTATTQSAAISAESNTTPLIQGTYLNADHAVEATGNTSLAYSYGVRLSSVSSVASRNPTVQGNTIWGPLAEGSASGVSMCVQVSTLADTTAVIEANDLRGGPAYQTFVVRVLFGATTEIRNNRIVTHEPTATGGLARGISNENTMALTVRNNSIVYGEGFSTKTAQAIYLGGSGATVIQNNILFSDPDSPTAHHGIYEGTAISPTVANNDIYDPGWIGLSLYHDSGGTDYTSIATFQGSGAATASGNLEEDPGLTAAWRLQASSPPGVRTGGLDGTAWDFDFDKDGNPRTVPWSMGCDEID